MYSRVVGWIEVTVMGWLFEQSLHRRRVLPAPGLPIRRMERDLDPRKYRRDIVVTNMRRREVRKMYIFEEMKCSIPDKSFKNSIAR